MVNALMRATEQLVGLILIRSNQRNSIARNLATKPDMIGASRLPMTLQTTLPLRSIAPDDSYLCVTDYDEKIGVGVTADKAVYTMPVAVLPARDRFRRLRLRQ